VAAQLTNGLISAYDHVQETPDVWIARLSAKLWGDRIPHVERGPDGVERWVVDGKPLALDGVALAGALMADPAHEPQRWEEVPAAAYAPSARLRSMDADGVDRSVLYPTVAGGGEIFGRITDPDLEIACVRAYNDWLLEEWGRASDRFIPQCLVPLFPADAAIAELQRAVGRGHKGVIYPSVPMELRDVPHLNGPEYDPFWAACEEIGVPLSIPSGSSQALQVPPALSLSPSVASAFRAITRGASTVSVVVNLLISRILMRHPKLQVVFAGSTLGWGAYQLEFADQQGREDGLSQEGYDLTPSQLFRRQCYLTGWYGKAGIQTRHIIGVDNILWATNFPRFDSSWPRTRECVASSFEGVPEDDRERILWRNAAELYRL
jgi:predicted TIM-barrel fold metal-dependent hydrolase